LIVVGDEELGGELLPAVALVALVFVNSQSTGPGAPGQSPMLVDGDRTKGRRRMAEISEAAPEEPERGWRWGLVKEYTVRKLC
jgi:hypothetical protein